MLDNLLQLRSRDDFERVSIGQTSWLQGEHEHVV